MKRFISLVIILSMVFGINVYASPMVEFSDISGHWGEEYIQRLANQDMVKGKGNGIFDPNGTLTVAEFITLSINVQGIKVDNTGDGKWYDAFVDQALELGFIYENQFDNYDRPITREEMAYIGVNAFGRLNALGSSLMTNEVIKKINDYHIIADQYKDGVLNSYLVGLFEGKPGNIFDPKGTATRAEASVVILKMIDETLRKPISFDDIPHVVTTYEVWAPDEEVFDPNDPSSTDGYIEKEVVLYAPINSNGERVTEVIDLFNFMNDYAKTTEYRVGSGYNVAGENVDIGTNSVTREEYDLLSLNEKVLAQELSLSIRLNDFEDASKYPYQLSFFGIDSNHYVEDFRAKHGELWNELMQTLFGNEREQVELMFTNAINGIANSVEGTTFTLKSAVPFNGRVFIGSGKGSSITIYISDSVHE